MKQECLVFAEMIIDFVIRWKSKSGFHRLINKNCMYVSVVFYQLQSGFDNFMLILIVLFLNFFSG